MRKVWRMFPGPLGVRIAIAVVLTTALLVALHFTYEWMGDFLVDSGGAIG